MTQGGLVELLGSLRRRKQNLDSEKPKGVQEDEKVTLELLSNLKRLWKILKNDQISGGDAKILRPIALKALAWMLLTELFWLLEVYPIKMFIDAITSPDGQQFWFGLELWQYVALLATAIFVFHEIGSLVHYCQDLAINSADWLFYGMINDYGTRKQLDLGVEFHAESGAAGKESVLGKNHKKVTQLLDYLIYSILPLTVRIVFTAVSICFVVWQVGILALGTLAVWLWAFSKIEPKIKPLREDFRKYTKQIEREDSELSNAAITIREQGLEDELSASHRSLLIEHWQEEIPRARQFWRYLLWEFRPVNVSRAVFFVVAFASFRAGASIGALVLAGSWMERIYSNLWRYSEFQHVLNEGEVALDELVGMFETEATIKQPENPQWPKQRRGRIVLDDLWFSYPNSTEAALKGVSLVIEPGMTVAFVGPSGGGKSTLAKLIAHLYDPCQGSILVDGVDLREIDDKRFRYEMLGMVAQSTGLFNQSIGRNIGMVKAGASMDEIRAAAIASGADEFIMKTAEGYETLIGENGVKLSGGQCQRLAISRALLRRPQILILDEPTSSLDAISQQWIKQTLEEWTARRQATILVIAHRFSTIEMADLVVVMEDGKIDGIGTHEELAKHNGLYNRLRHYEGLLD